jgi:hypothetical protein
VRVNATEGVTQSYLWGDKSIEFFRCRNCGCITHWEAVGKPADRMGVNARLMAPEVLAAAHLQRLDGADTWRYLEE